MTPYAPEPARIVERRIEAAHGGRDGRARFEGLLAKVGA